MMARRSLALKHFQKSALLCTVFAMAALSGCHKKSKLPPLPDAMAPSTSTLPAPTAEISADPLAIDLGQSVVLNWRTTDATSVSIDGIGQVNVNGTQTVSPANSTNFHLVAKGDGGTTEANVRVTVRVPEVPTMPASGTSGADANGGLNGGLNGSGGDIGTEAAFHQNVQDIYFDYDSFELRGDAQTAASAAARYLNQHTGIKLLIGGYCDDRGSAEYNITLGENRANSAKTALVSAGVSPNRIRVVSFGKEKQFCSDETEACWQQNRRAQFTMDK